LLRLTYQKLDKCDEKSSALLLFFLVFFLCHRDAPGRSGKFHFIFFMNNNEREVPSLRWGGEEKSRREQEIVHHLAISLRRGKENTSMSDRRSFFLLPSEDEDVNNFCVRCVFLLDSRAHQKKKESDLHISHSLPLPPLYVDRFLLLL
jgi:hypothetical protein